MKTEHNPYNPEYPKHVSQYRGPKITERGYTRTFIPDPNEFEEQKCGCGCQQVLTGTDYQITHGFYDQKHKIRHKKNNP